MSRANQQIARLIQELIRGVQTGKIRLRWIIGLVILVVAYFVLQPVLEKSLGIDLPGLNDLATGSQGHQDENSRSRNPSTANLPTRSPAKVSPAGDLEKIFRSGRGTYVSPAGLRYTRGSKQGHRLKHLMAHARDEPDRPGQHGVFQSNAVGEVVVVVDEAYLQAQTGRDTRTRREAERIIYDVNLRRPVGYIGGTSGNRKNHPVAKHLRLVVDGDRLITAFPVRP